ncbi:MAG TPA: thiamine ABC transporter substrate-binding protein [Ilumatobacteraceae bacterium]|nr:thiamine ABC transporter substrate-binding protein [Ilumatobacteraceae bacterium]
MSEATGRGSFRSSRWVALAGATALLVAVSACGSDEDEDHDNTSNNSVAVGRPPIGPSGSTGGSTSGETITLVTYDSFPEADTPLNETLGAFTEQTGIDVEILVAGDAGTMLSKASLTAGNPEGDVMWGVDNTLLSRAVTDGVFDPYIAAGILDGSVTIDDAFTSLVPNGEATPVDYGDVCVNYDIGWFAERNLEPPTTLADLADPAYAGMLVVQNPATSSPGLAFLLATIHEYGLEGWQAYWNALGANGVEVVESWTQAYYERFTWAGGGPTPMVVSYGSSPPAEVIFADPPRNDSPTGVIEDTCFRQVEFAGVLRGTDSPDAARQLVDFLVGEEFQAELPLNLFVYPTNQAVDLPQEFVDFAVVPDASRSLDPAVIDANRAIWIDEWTELVLG